MSYDDVTVTRSGARLRTVYVPPSRRWVAVRDDGRIVYLASSRWDVTDYLTRYGHTIAPTPPDRQPVF